MKKKLYKDFVMLTQEEYDKIGETYWDKRREKYMIDLNWYIWQIGERKAKKNYVSHYHTILNWIRKAGVKKFVKQEPEKEVVNEMSEEQKEIIKQKYRQLQQKIC